MTSAAFAVQNPAYSLTACFFEGAALQLHLFLILISASRFAKTNYRTIFY